MAKPSRFNVLARLFPRTRNAVIGQLYTHVLNRPLFVEPALGERLLGAYMQGDYEYGGTPLVESSGKIAIINVSGALASRPMPGPSGDGPQNYEQLFEQFDRALADASVGAIIMRLDSPGGFVAGCFDLTDYIFESRGTKPIVAVVDDMAYSAAYAIAAACDEIWVTRTGGVGSVGVVAYHIDQSGADAQEGLKVTAIYAGAHKNDFTPHEPLSDAARAREQAEVDRLYELFTDSIARYRGMTVDAVEATEALTYSGPDALAIGFADKLGTLDDAIDALLEPPETAGQRAAREAAEAENERRRVAEAAEAELQRRRGLLAAAVATAELPDDVKQAITQGPVTAELSEADAKARVEYAAEVVAACALAKLEKRAASYVARNVPIADVKKELLDYRADLDEAIRIAHTIPPAGTNGGARVPGAWDKSIVKFGGKLK